MDPRTLPLASILHIARELILLVMDAPRLTAEPENQAPYAGLASLVISSDPAALQALLSALNARFAIDVGSADITSDRPQSIGTLIDIVWTKLIT
jgi:hypothetical protein